MIVVYWLQKGFGDFAEANFETFDANDLGGALKFAEELRARRKAKPELKISHVDVKAELPESVGQDGVRSAGADYAWYKRRQDPSIPVGRKPTSDDIEVELE